MGAGDWGDLIREAAVEAGSPSIPPREGGLVFIISLYAYENSREQTGKSERMNHHLDAAKRKDTTRKRMPLNRHAHRDPALR